MAKWDFAIRLIREAKLDSDRVKSCIQMGRIWRNVGIIHTYRSECERTWSGRKEGFCPGPTYQIIHPAIRMQSSAVTIRQRRTIQFAKRPPRKKYFVYEYCQMRLLNPPSSVGHLINDLKVSFYYRFPPPSIIHFLLNFTNTKIHL